VTTEGEEGGGEREAREMREKREAEASVGGRMGGLGEGEGLVVLYVGFGECVGRLAQ
jgi:hypothetical protein